ncbi:MAG TPA: hypothetical protein VFZ87_02810 [Gemmatimonadales bacterium]
MVGGPGAPEARDRTPWIIAGVSLAALLAVVLIMVARQSPAPPKGPGEVAALAPASSEAPPDISSLSPRERFNRLYNRVMRAAQEGDQGTVTRFTPMALMAYAQLDSFDADARYHAALLKVHTGEADASRALADTILAEAPGHLFGYVIRGTVARFRKDDKALSQAYAGFLQRYDAEMKQARAEYGEHRTSLDEFRKAAQGARVTRKSGS